MLMSFEEVLIIVLSKTVFVSTNGILYICSSYCARTYFMQLFNRGGFVTKFVVVKN